MANVLNLINRQFPHSIPYQMFSGKACAAIGSIAALAILMLGTHSYQQTENVRFQRVVDYLIMNPIQRVISSRLVNSIGYEIYYFKFKITEYCGDLKERVSRNGTLSMPNFKLF